MALKELSRENKATSSSMSEKSVEVRACRNLDDKESAQELSQDGPNTKNFKSWVKKMTKAIGKAKRESEAHFQVETRNLRLKEAIKESELAMWKAKADKTEEF